MIQYCVIGKTPDNMPVTTRSKKGKDNDAMTKTMTPSSITADQIGKIQELLGAGLRKADLRNKLIQQVIETRGDALIAELVAVVRKYADAVIPTEMTAGLVAVVRKYADAVIPTEMTVGGRTYDVLSFLREGEDRVEGDVMVGRAKEMSAHLGEDDGQHILKHQADIPVVFRGMFVFIFTDWWYFDDSENVIVNDVYWAVDRWVETWRRLDDVFSGRCLVLRRK